MKKEERYIRSLDEMKDFAKYFVEDHFVNREANAAKIFALSGELGAGKTTFVRAVAETLGVERGVVSPTFTIERRYPVKHPHFDTLVHIDAYRLRGEDDALTLDLATTFSDPRNIVFLEWPENIGTLIPKEARKISFTHIDEMTRKIEIK